MSMDDNDLGRDEILKPAFPWPGGKQQSVPIILPHLPYTDYYREPFGGSGAILLARQKVKNEYFNDRFSGVTDFYHCVKNRDLLERLLAWLDFTPFSREEFLRCRGTWRDASDIVERAARWYCSVLMSFQAYGRHYGRSKQANARFSMKLPNQLDKFWPIHYRLQGCYVENQSWEQMCNDLDNPRAVWYMDPPYLETAEGMYEFGFKYEDHVHLIERSFRLQGFVAISGYRHPLYEKYPWSKVLEWEVRSTANAGIGTESNKRQNSVALNNETRIECLYIKEFS